MARIDPHLRLIFTTWAYEEIGDGDEQDLGKATGVIADAEGVDDPGRDPE